MLTFIFASTSIVLALLTYLNARRAKELNQILTAGARKFEQQHEQLTSTQNRLSAAADLNASLEGELKQLKQTQEHEGARNAKIVGELLNTQALIERKLGNAEAQRDHILAKYEALTDERDHLLSERSDGEQLVKTLEVECDRLQSELDRSVKKSSTANTDEINRLKQRINQLEAETKTQSSQHPIDPNAVDTMRRKITQNEQLYLSMKSLREMAEERNRNWEIALKKLSTWILTSSHLAQPRDPVLLQSTVGPLVGEALERIGGNLLDDDDSSDVAIINSENIHSAES